MASCCYQAAVRLAVAALLVTSLAGDVSAQRGTNTVALNELAREFDANRQAKQTPAYFALLNSAAPAQQALNVAPGIQLMYMRETGAPAYYTIDNLTAALTIRT